MDACPKPSTSSSTCSISRRIEVNVYRGINPKEERQRTFGGQVAAQALMAAGRTVERRTRALTALVLPCARAIRPRRSSTRSTEFATARASRRDASSRSSTAARSTTCRRVFTPTKSASSTRSRCPTCPGPRRFRPLAERSSAISATSMTGSTRQHPIDQRFIGRAALESDARQGATPMLWIRADGALPDDPLLHACVVTYASDMSLIDAIVRPHSINWDDGSVHGREPGPLHVVPPRPSRRRVAALRHRVAHRLRRTGPRAGLSLLARWRTQGLDGPRGPTRTLVPTRD